MCYFIMVDTCDRRDMKLFSLGRKRRETDVHTSAVKREIVPPQYIAGWLVKRPMKYSTKTIFADQRF